MSEEVAAAASLPSRLARFRNDLLNDARVGDYEALGANVSSLLAHVVQVEREKAEIEAEMAHTRADLAAVRAELAQERRATEAERAARRNAEADSAALASKLNELLNEIEVAEEVGCWPKQGIVNSGWRLDRSDRPGRALLAELDAARKVVATLRKWMTREVRGNALTVALAAYDQAVQEGQSSE